MAEEVVKPKYEVVQYMGNNITARWEGFQNHPSVQDILIAAREVFPDRPLSELYITYPDHKERVELVIDQTFRNYNRDR